MHKRGSSACNCRICACRRAGSSRSLARIGTPPNHFPKTAGAWRQSPGEPPAGRGAAIHSDVVRACNCRICTCRRVGSSRSLARIGAPPNDSPQTAGAWRQSPGRPPEGRGAAIHSNVNTGQLRLQLPHMCMPPGGGWGHHVVALPHRCTAQSLSQVSWRQSPSGHAQEAAHPWRRWRRRRSAIFVAGPRPCGGSCRWGAGCKLLVWGRPIRRDCQTT